MLKRYKEIVFGLLLGGAMWLTDAAMHAHLGAAAASAGFWDEVFRPGPTQLAFRAGYVALAVGFGSALWRANWRERELKALEAAFMAFNRQLGTPAVRLVSHSRMLCGCGCVNRDEMAASLAHAVHEDARAIDYLAQQYLQFSEQIRAGQTTEATATLRAVADWRQNQAHAQN
jgi:outer membrane murein-binding lipoprotein Lpp